MTYLFKLKKDGKTVGYMNIDKGIHWSDEVSIPSNPIDFDTAHPFVCKDKNGEDVWFDNEVWLKRDGFKLMMKFKAIAGFDDWAWLYQKTGSTYHWEIAYQGDIELIEEKK